MRASTRQASTVTSQAMRESDTRLFSRPVADGAPRLTPKSALAYLGELSVDVLAAAVLDPRTGAVLAGDPALAGPPPDALTASGQRHAIAVRLGPMATPGLIAHDLHRILDDLGGTD